MNRHSNKIIIFGAILLVLVLIFRYSNFHLGGITNFWEQYKFWFILLIVVIGLAVLSRWNRLSGIKKFLTTPLKLLLGVVLVYVAIHFFPTEKWTEIMRSFESSDATPAQVEKVVTVAYGRPGSANTNGKKNCEFRVPHPTKVEYLNAQGRPIPVKVNGRRVTWYIDSPAVDLDVESDLEAIKSVRFTSMNRSFGQYSFDFITW
jgi:hypothetical protein